MPDVKIAIGGREFEVACPDGEEAFLRAAAAMLDAEAQAIVSQIGRLPEARMLLMAGLMLADKTAALEDQLRAAEAQAAETAQPAPPPVVKPDLGDLPDLVARAEALANKIEAVAG